MSLIRSLLLKTKLYWRLLIKTKGLDKANVHYLKLKGFPLALFAQGRGRALPNDSTQSLELQNPLHHTLGQVQMAAAQKQCKKVHAVSNSFSMANVIIHAKFNFQLNFALKRKQKKRERIRLLKSLIATIGRLVCVLEGIEAGVKHESDEKLRKHLKERDKKRLQV